jgi:hypothetical protein
MDVDRLARLSFTVFVVTAFFMGIVLGYLDNEGNPHATLAEAYITLLMIIIGTAIGLISIKARDSTSFLVASVALIVAGTTFIWGPLQYINPVLRICAVWILNLMVAFGIPIAIINAVKAVLTLTKNT